ncbi:BBE domain-containing protein [Streptomyces sp. A30]|uniref:BBE domain-containing protein n=1 Tax=Streptomyces sp. A30 TaxID=2789273 RepID=UPI0039806BEA
MWDEPEPDQQYDRVKNFNEAMRPRSLTSGYINLTDDRGEQWRHGVHGSEAKHQRLRAAKAAWDPHNLLRYNKNITPENTGSPREH